MIFGITSFASPKKYFEFCNAEYGEIIHHRPLPSVTPVPETSIRNFVETYGIHMANPAQFGSSMCPLLSLTLPTVASALCHSIIGGPDGLGVER